MPTKTLTLAQKALYIVPFAKLPSSRAWKLTSEYVRKSSGGIGYTCNGRFPLEKLSAGHFIEKRGNANTYFDLQNLRAQCTWNCNRKAGGRKVGEKIKELRIGGRSTQEELHKAIERTLRGRVHPNPYFNDGAMTGYNQAVFDILEILAPNKDKKE